MAIAIARVRSQPDSQRIISDVTLDGSYASGGYAVTAGQLGLLTIDHMNAWFRGGEGFIAEYIPSTGKIKCLKSAGAAGAMAECVAGDLSTANVVRVEAIGAPVL
jgi:hypothetical protein